MPLAFSAIYKISDKLDLATDGDVIAAEAAFSTRFPAGYREYVTTLGDGFLNYLVQVVVPSRLAHELAEFRDRQAGEGSLFYDLAPLPLPRLLESILLFTTDTGHQGVFHPDVPDTIYVFPHDEEHIYTIQGSLADVLDWVFSTGILSARERTQVLSASGDFVERPFHYFEPSGNRRRIEFSGSGTVTSDELSSALMSFARANMDTVTCVLHHSEHVGTWVQLLVRECSADVHPFGPSRDADRYATISITYDPGLALTRLDPLFDYFDSIGYRRSDYAY